MTQRIVEAKKASNAPVLTTQEWMVGKQGQDMTQASVVNIYLNREWYLLIKEYINARITEPNVN